MKNFTLILFLAVIALSSCKKDPDNVWEDERFSTTIEGGGSDIVNEDFIDEVHKFGTISFELNSLSKDNYGANKVVKYTYYVDSLSFALLEKKVVLSYELNTNNVSIDCNNEALNQSGDLSITLHGTWYFEDIDGIKYADGDTVKFGNEDETIVVKYINELPFKFNPKFVKDDFDDYFFFVPKVSGGVEIDTELESGNDIYKVKLEGYLTIGSDTTDVIYDTVENSTYSFQVQEALTTDKNYDCTIKAQWYVKSLNGEWLYCTGSDEEVAKSYFTGTISAIDSSFFKTTYPLYRQCNFLKDEYNKGYFRTKSNVLDEYLGQNYKVVCSTLDSVEVFQSEITYNREYEVFEYEIPSGVMENNKIYELKFNDKLTNQTLCSYHFRTSVYSSFKEKWVREKTLGSTDDMWIDLVEPYLYSNNVNLIPVNESFDMYETLEAYGYGKPLIQFESSIPSSWLNTKEYKMYSVDGLVKTKDIDFLFNVKGNSFAEIPLDAIYFLSAGTRLLSDAMISNNEYDINIRSGRMEWRVLVTMHYDYWSNAEEIDEKYSSSPSIFDDLDFDQFIIPPMDISYVLPGINLTTSKIEDFSIGDKIAY